MKPTTAETAPPETDSAEAPVLTALGGGANQAGGRAYNERLTLSLIRLNGPLPKADLARLTGLSAQTMSLIVRALATDGLLVAQEPVRGRVGQPSVPYALAPRGVLSFGVKIGRRSAEVMLCDFLGEPILKRRQSYVAPLPERVVAFVLHAIRAMRARMPADSRYAGIGIAMPFELWKWADEVEVPDGTLDGWRDLDIRARIEEASGLPACLANDATAACGAELAHSYRGSNVDMLYFFIGAFIGGGVVLNGALHQGRTGNAGALGSMPIAVGGRMTQLIHHASLITLEKAVVRAGGTTEFLEQMDGDWAHLEPTLTDWIGRTAETLATAIVAGVSIIDFEHVCIDGALPRAVLARIVEGARAAAAAYDRQGLSPFEIRMGSLGAEARVLGGAMLPIVAGFGAGQDIMLKQGAGG